MPTVMMTPKGHSVKRILCLILTILAFLALMLGCKDRTARKPQQADTLYLTAEDVQWEPYFEFDSTIKGVDLRSREAYTAKLLKEEAPKKKHSKGVCIFCKDKSTTTVIISKGDGNTLAGGNLKDKSKDTAVKGDGNTTTGKVKDGPVISGDGNKVSKANGLPWIWIILTAAVLLLIRFRKLLGFPI